MSKSPSQPTVTPSGSTNQEVAIADKLTAYFKERYEADKAIVVKPFVLDSALSKPDIPAYTAVVKDGSSKLEVWTHNLIYIFYSDRELARSGFEHAKITAISQGAGNPIKGDNYWLGIIGTWSKAVGTKEAAIHVCQPNYLCGEDFWLTFSDDFVVATDYKNRIE